MPPPHSEKVRLSRPILLAGLNLVRPGPTSHFLQTKKTQGQTLFTSCDRPLRLVLFPRLRQKLKSDHRYFPVVFSSTRHSIVGHACRVSRSALRRGKIFVHHTFVPLNVGRVGFLISMLFFFPFGELWTPPPLLLLRNQVGFYVSPLSSLSF